MNLSKRLKQSFINYVLRLADSSLTMGQRLAEWCGHGPYLEEDIALTNISLDYFGHANMFYANVVELLDDKRSTDDLAFLRDVHEFRNPIITELPKGDFAYTLLKQYFIDCFNQMLYSQLLNCAYKPLRHSVAKAVKETNYHIKRSELWVQRLALGTDESRNKVQKSLDELWYYTPELFETHNDIRELEKKEMLVDPAGINKQWSQKVESLLVQTCQLSLPENGWVATGGYQGEHSEHLGYMLAEMQFLQRAYPGCEW